MSGTVKLRGAMLGGFLSFMLALLTTLNNLDGAQPNKGRCGGAQATLLCLRENFHELAQENYKRFWDILYLGEKRALRCKPIVHTAGFLEVAKVIEYNAEVTEYFKETLETKFLRARTSCFLDALLLVDEDARRVILEDYLTRPFTMTPVRVRRIFAPYKDMPKYRQLLQPYFRAEAAAAPARGGAQAEGLCGGADATLQCLRDNLETLYRQNPHRFWDIIQRAEAEAVRCTSPERTAEFVGLAGIIGGIDRADLAYIPLYFVDVLETDLLKPKPRCLLDALLQADTASRKVILEDYLQRPSFLEDREVRRILSRYRNSDRYKRLLEPYFRK